GNKKDDGGKNNDKKDKKSPDNKEGDGKGEKREGDKGGKVDRKDGDGKGQDRQNPVGKKGPPNGKNNNQKGPGPANKGANNNGRNAAPGGPVDGGKGKPGVFGFFGNFFNNDKESGGDDGGHQVIYKPPPVTDGNKLNEDQNNNSNLPFNLFGIALLNKNEGGTISNSVASMDGAVNNNTVTSAVRQPSVTDIYLTWPKADNGAFKTIYSDDASISKFNNEVFSGHTYASKNGLMRYLRIERGMVNTQNAATAITTAFGANSGDQLAGIIGTKIAPNADNTREILENSAYSATKYYDFLPEMRTYYNSSASEVGFFDWSVPNTALLPAGVSSADATNITKSTRRGMVVDGTSKRFVAGYLNWNFDTTKSELIVGYGAIGKAIDSGNSSGNSLYGAAFDMLDQGNSSFASRAGNIFVKDNMYGDTNNGIEGFILEGSVAGHPAGNISQGVIVDDGNAASSDSSVLNAHNNLGKTLRGYAAGFITRGSGTNPIGYWNDEDMGVEISIGNNSSMGGHFNLETTSSPSASTNIEGTFGNKNVLSNSYSAADAYISDQIYAMGQSGFAYGGNSVNNHDNLKKGVLVSSYSIIDSADRSTMQCTSCEHAHWGVWASEVTETTDPNTPNKIHMIPYVAGQVSSGLAGTIGLVDYAGVVLASVFDGSKVYHKTGSFTSQINVGARDIVNFRVTMPNVTGSTTKYFAQDNAIAANNDLIGSPQAVFSNMALDETNATFSTQVTDKVGTANGALFGNSAQDMGGNMNVTSGSLEINGVFIGHGTPQ
ncbi:hypothetical protein N9W34_02590, partial [Rickettsiales bacterium]|nr:hypothetical protein [Rickettsiales bacterium]